MSANTQQSRRWLLLSCVLLLIFWITLCDFPCYAAGGLSPDESWAHAYSHFFKHKLQAGVDYVFTYGPLGFFMVTAHDPELFWHKFAWELGIKFLFALTFVELIKSLPGNGARLAASVTLLVFGHWLVYSWSALYVLVTLIQILLLLDPSRPPSSGVLMYRSTLLAVLSLTKFTLFSFILPAIAVVALVYFASGKWRSALLFLSTFVIAWGSTWIGLGQGLGNATEYIVRSVEVATGYNEAMATPGSRDELRLAITVLVLIAACLIGVILRSSVACAPVIVLGLAMFFQWKAGFVRQDAGHVLIFFSTAVWFPFLVLSAFPDCRWHAPPRTLLLGGIYFLCATGIVLTGLREFDPRQIVSKARQSFQAKLDVVRSPARLKRRLDREFAYRASTNELARIKSIVQRDSIDVVSFAQGTLLLNKLNWQPRPVFQGYSAYTPELGRLNAEFFTSPEAPRYVLFKLETIDNRHPLLDDGQAVLEVLARYEPVLAERGFLLLKRSEPTAETGQTRVSDVDKQTITWNQEVEFHGNDESPIRVSLDVRPTLQEKLRSAFYKPCPLSIRIRTSDGETHTFRYLPALGRAGFLFNPLLLDNADVLDFFAGAPTKKVVAFTLVADRKAMAGYEPEIEMLIRREPAPRMTASRFDADAFPKRDISSNLFSGR